MLLVAYGLSVPLLPMAGRGTLLACSILYLLISDRRSLKEITLHPFFLCVCAAWCAGHILFGFGVGGGANDIFSTVHPKWVLGLSFLLRITVFLALIRHFQNSPKQQGKFWIGLSSGLAISFTLGLLQILGTLPFHLPSESSYWESQLRYGGTFSDPNSQGIFMVFLIPLLFDLLRRARGVENLSEAVGVSACHRVYLAVLVVSAFILGLYTGSRSFFLGLAVFALLGLWRKRRILFLIFMLSLIWAVFLVNRWYLIDSEGFEAVLAKLPSGIGRLIFSLVWWNLNDALFSRLVFWKMAWQMWLDSPFLGKGLGSFIYELPFYRLHIAPEIGNWIDNANNFYLSVLSEMGIVGFIGLLAVISAFKVKEDVKGIVGNAPLALLIMLFFGPHLNFDEVLVLTAFVSSLCLEHKPKLLLARFSLLKKAVMVFLFGAILYRSYLSQYGFYPAEFNKSTKEIIEWSRKKGVGWVSCDDGIGRISLRAINPDVARNPVKVSVKSSLGQLEDIELRDFSQRIVELDCADLKKLRYSFYISRLWNPSDFGMVHDSRSLGVQFVLPYDKWKL